MKKTPCSQTLEWNPRLCETLLPSLPDLSNACSINEINMQMVLSGRGL